MSNAIPAGRMQLSELAPRQYAASFRLSSSIELDHQLRELIDVRASQINGCAFCLDMPWKDARAAGETEERLYMLDAWRESAVYSDRERAALELCEAITLIGDGHLPDEVWKRARASFDEDELSQLAFAITTINTWNRILITTRVEPGHHRTGEFRESADATADASPAGRSDARSEMLR
jgi:AhpD family alkylhydroperoxidase